MSPSTIAIAGIILLVILFLLRMPVAYAMALIGFVGFASVTSTGAALSILGKDFWVMFSSYSLTVVPMFVLMGTIAFYSGRHLAMIELAASVKLLLYISLLACLFGPWGLAAPEAGIYAHAVGLASYVAKLAAGGVLLAVFETVVAKMRVFRVPEFLGAALMLGLLGTLLLFVSRSL